MRLPVRLEFVVAVAAVAAVPIGLAFAGGGSDDPERANVANERAADDLGEDGAGGAWDLDGDSAGVAEEQPTTPATQEPADGGGTAPQSDPEPAGQPQTEPDQDQPAPQSAPPTIPAVNYSYSGDIAGRIIKTSVDVNGHWTRTENRTGTSSGQLTAAQMAALGLLLRSPQLAAEAGQEGGGGGLLPGGNCADVPTMVLSTQGYEFRSGCEDPLPPTAADVVGLIHEYTGG